MVATSVDACWRVGRATLREVEKRTTTRFSGTRDVPWDEHCAPQLPPLRAVGRGVASWTCRMVATRVQAPPTWTMARMRRTDGVQLAGTHPKGGTKDGGKRLRRWTSDTAVDRSNCFVEAVLHVHGHARELPRGRGRIQRLTLRRLFVTTNRITSSATSSYPYPSHVSSRALQQARRHVDTSAHFNLSKRWTHEPHVRACLDRAVPRVALRMRRGRSRRCIATHTPHAGEGRRSCTFGARMARLTDAMRSKEARRKRRRKRSAPRGGR